MNECRGITPAYIDEVGQQQIVFSDFLAGPNFFAFCGADSSRVTLTR